MNSIYKLPFAAIASALLCLGQANYHQDEAAISKIVSDMWDAWNTHKAQEIVKDYSADHDHINVFGGWHRNRADLLKMYERNFAPGGPWDKSPPFKGAGLIKLRFVRPDVAAAIVGAVKTVDRRAMTSTWILHKENGRWIINTFHNTMDVDLFGLPSRPKGESPPPVVTGRRTAEDESAVRSTIAEFWKAWNEHDAQRMVRDLAYDHDHINTFAGFCQWIPRRAIAADVEHDFTLLALSRAHKPDGVFGRMQVKNVEVEKLRFLRPDVVVAIVETTWHDGNRSRSSWLMSKEDGRWVVTNFQITAQMDISKMPQ